MQTYTYYIHDFSNNFHTKGIILLVICFKRTPKLNNILQTPFHVIYQNVGHNVGPSEAASLGHAAGWHRPTCQS